MNYNLVFVAEVKKKKNKIVENLYVYINKHDGGANYLIMNAEDSIPCCRYNIIQNIIWVMGYLWKSSYPELFDETIDLATVRYNRALKNKEKERKVGIAEIQLPLVKEI
jgi:hypothetical protein